MKDQDNNFCLISLSVLINYLRTGYNVWILLEGKVTCYLFVGVEGLRFVAYCNSPIWL